jgi:hypothetical protein
LDDVRILTFYFFSYVMLPGLSDLWSGNINEAVASFFSNSAASQGTYGPIASWHMAGVTNFEYLFCGSGFVSSIGAYCGTAYDLGV